MTHDTRASHGAHDRADAHDTVALLGRLRAETGCRVVAYASQRLSPADVDVMYQCLREEGHTERTALLLHSGGGDIHLARRLALLLREYTRELHVLVPGPAVSAGTLLCLAGDELVLGPAASLSPIDPQLSSSQQLRPTELATLSAEDVRLFPQVCAEWFAPPPERAGDTLQALLRAVSPATVSRFFRAEREVTSAASELLALSCPDVPQTTRDAIVARLVTGFHDHRHEITRDEARRIGLRVRHASPAEEDLMWRGTRVMWAGYYSPTPDRLTTVGLVASDTGFRAEQLVGRREGPDSAVTYWTVHRP